MSGTHSGPLSISMSLATPVECQALGTGHSLFYPLRRRCISLSEQGPCSAPDLGSNLFFQGEEKSVFLEVLV